MYMYILEVLNTLKNPFNRTGIVLYVFVLYEYLYSMDLPI